MLNKYLNRNPEITYREIKQLNLDEIGELEEIPILNKNESNCDSDQKDEIKKEENNNLKIHSI